MKARRAWLAAGVAVGMLTVALVSVSLTLIMVRLSQSGSATPYSQLDKVRSIIEREYYKEVDEDTLITGAARGMLEELQDPYTFYYTTDAMTEMHEYTEGKYAGIGLSLTVNPKDNTITVLRAYRGAPGAQAGIRAGDKIVEVLGKPVTGDDMDTAVSMMKGEPGTAADIVIQRGEERISLTLTRQTVTINRAEYRVLDGNIGYIEISEFLGNDVKCYKEAIRELQNQKVSGLIIDVRGNPGGLLQDVCEIADTLVPKGLIVYTEDRAGERRQEFSDADFLGLPLVVLVDQDSASASEILAGAVQDHGVGKIVGVQTFGKGIVQTMHEFPETGSGMQLTTSRYFTPNGVCIHGIGISPDVYVTQKKEVLEHKEIRTDENDRQLEKGLEVLDALINAGKPMPTGDPTPAPTATTKAMGGACARAAA